MQDDLDGRFESQLPQPGELIEETTTTVRKRYRGVCPVPAPATVPQGQGAQDVPVEAAPAVPEDCGCDESASDE